MKASYSSLSGNPALTGVDPCVSLSSCHSYWRPSPFCPWSASTLQPAQEAELPLYRLKEGLKWVVKPGNGNEGWPYHTIKITDIVVINKLVCYHLEGTNSVDIHDSEYHAAKDDGVYLVDGGICGLPLHIYTTCLFFEASQQASKLKAGTTMASMIGLIILRAKKEPNGKNCPFLSITNRSSMMARKLRPQW